MQKHLFALSLGFAGVVLLAAEARGQTSRCAPREEVIAHLAESFGETRRAIGLVRNVAVVELFAADATRTWTITVTHPDGTTCLVAAGEAYESVTEALPPAGWNG